MNILNLIQTPYFMAVQNLKEVKQEYLRHKQYHQQLRDEYVILDNEQKTLKNQWYHKK